jgi:hypothetical protein
MRGFSFSVIRGTSLTPTATKRRGETYDAAAISDRLNRSMRRRLSDDLVNLIRRACRSGHLTTAERLVDVLRDLFTIEKQQFPRRLHPTESVIETLIDEIAVAKARKSAA